MQIINTSGYPDKKQRKKRQKIPVIHMKKGHDNKPEEYNIKCKIKNQTPLFF